MGIEGKKVVVLAEDLYEDLELWYPYYRLKEAGAEVSLRGTGKPAYQSKHGLPVEVDGPVDQADPGTTAAVVVPGGYSPDKMRKHRPLIKFVRGVFDDGGHVAFICHGGWVPASADIVRDRKVTSAPSIQDDLRNAGAEWVDQEVVHDGGLVSSRRPADLPAFCRTLIEVLAEG